MGKKDKKDGVTQQEKTLYDFACEALEVKMNEDSYQQVIGNIDKSYNVQQEYYDTLHNLYMSKHHPDQFWLNMPKQEAERQQNKTNHVILCNLLVNTVPEDTISETFAFTQTLKADIAR